MRVTLNGIVSADDDLWVYEWFGYTAFSPQAVRRALADKPEGEDLVLEINSGGGSVMAGSEIYSVLRSAQGVHTVAEIQSMAASAASYLCLGCDEVHISPVAQMMIHLPATSTDGDRTDHLRSVQMLDSTREAILNAYELRAGSKADRAQLRRMMTAETWLTAQEAVDYGLADKILYQEEAAPAPASLVAAAGAGIRALGTCQGVPDIMELRAKIAQMHLDPEAGPAAEITAPAGGAPGADKAQDWQAQARLDLEKIRYYGGTR